MPSQVCITKDNTQLQVDGILYFQVTDPQLASYGSRNYVAGDHAACADDAAQRHRQHGARPDVRGARPDQREAWSPRSTRRRTNWGVKVLRYEIKDLTPPKEILRAMQAQITAEREKRAVIATSEGRRQEQINIASGAREAAIASSEGEKQARDQQCAGTGAAHARDRRGEREAHPQVAEAIRQPGGFEAVNLGRRAVHRAFGNLARTNNTLIVPANLADISTLVASALTVVKAQPAPR